MYLSKKSVYLNPYKYAYICDVPIEYARIVQKRQNNISKIIYNANIIRVLVPARRKVW